LSSNNELNQHKYKNQMSMMRTMCFWLLLFIIAGTAVHAQTRTITGTVTDESGVALTGVNVVVKGTTNGTITDASGGFAIAVPAGGGTLVFTYLGVETSERQIGSSNVVDVVLESATIGMDEVVVVGYGTQKKSDITGAVASVGQERLESSV